LRLRRQSYGIPEWERHRDISRYFRHLTSIPRRARAAGAAARCNPR
jgi:hypothetical protein